MLIFLCIVIATPIVLLVVVPQIATDEVVNNLSNSTQNKATIGDSNIFIDYPWGDKQKLKVFVDVENVLIEDRDYNNYTVLLAMKWWETDRTHNLSYKVNFTLSNNSQDADIIIFWNDSLTSNPTDRGYTHINSSGVYDRIGADVCDTYKLPFKKCKIEVRSNLSYDEKLYVVKHELGHTLVFKHIFNKNDFFIRRQGFDTNYYLSPSEIMFEKINYDTAQVRIRNKTEVLHRNIVIGLIVILIIAILLFRLVPKKPKAGGVMLKKPNKF